MRKTMLKLGVVSLTLLSSSTVFGAAWNVPTNVRVVQKSNTDTVGRIYGTVQAAINSITNASATNPYVVKVMPGVYAEAVTLKPYVTLEGSGSENTTITAANDNVDGLSCSLGTVVMSSNSVIRNIKVINSKTTPAFATALVFNGVNAKAENISVFAGGDTSTSGISNGVCSFGGSSIVDLENSIIETRKNGGQSNSIITNGAKLSVSNSKLISNNTVNGLAIGVNTAPGAPTGFISIKNSSIEVTCPDSRAEGLVISTNSASINNSTITLNVNNGVYASASGFSSAWGVNTNITITDTRFITDSPIKFGYNPGQMGMNFKVANSQLPGSTSSLSSAKLVNNYDDNFNLIPNQ